MANLGRKTVLLAPPDRRPPLLKHIVEDDSLHGRLLAAIQKLRGQIYLFDRAISAADLTADGRHIQKADSLSWHILTLNEQEEVLGCMRISEHGAGVSFSDLLIYDSLSQILDSGSLVREAVQTEIEKASRRGFSYVEIGGWAIREDFRCTTEAVRMLLMTYSFGKLIGGAYGISTVTTRHQSSSILRRFGGTPLVPPYYDPHYGCDMELLRFDSTCPNPRYTKWIEDSYDVLAESTVISNHASVPDPSSLLNLKRVLSEFSTSGTPWAEIHEEEAHVIRANQ